MLVELRSAVKVKQRKKGRKKKKRRVENVQRHLLLQTVQREIYTFQKYRYVVYVVC